MASLSEIHPYITNKFCEGKFTVQKTRRIFSSITIDHAHEQNSAAVKGDGGEIGLTQNSNLLCHWTVVGPEVARFISEFEKGMESAHDVEADTQPHEQTKSIQVTFSQHFKALVRVMEDMGNSFTENAKDLYKLDTKEITDQAVVDVIQMCEMIGQNQCKVSSLKNDVVLFLRLCIACQTCDGDIIDFFKHENQAYPPGNIPLWQYTFWEKV